MIGVCLANWEDSLLIGIIQLVLITIVAIIALLSITFILSLIFGIKDKDAQSSTGMNMKGELDTFEWEEDEEDEDKRKARRKAMRRIKKLQREYPDMWELMVDPDDEYLCFDYINDKKQKKRDRQTFESSIFGASCINDFHHDSGDYHSDFSD